MPLYEFECIQCKNKFEKVSNLKDRKKAVNCPNCGNQAKRILSSFAFGNNHSNLPTSPQNLPSTCGS